MRIKSIIICLLAITTLASCKKNETMPAENTKFKKGGVFIINEGNYSSANSSLTYYNPETDTTVSNVFYKANNVPLGDVAQYMCIHENKAYITVNNSGTIYSINPSDGSYKGSITNLVSPRSILIVNKEKAYVSDLNSGSITVFNPETMDITGIIDIGKSTEAMLMHNNKVYVSNWSSFYQTKMNNTLMVIDPLTDKIIDSIVVGIEPQSMEIDKVGSLWVLCSGGYSGDEYPSLWKINTIDNSVIRNFTFPEITSSPEDLCINAGRDTLYFRNGDVFAMPILETEIPETSIIPADGRTFYSLAISPENEIYVTDALDYSRNGEVYRYTVKGELVTSFKAGIIPGQVVFYE